MAGAIDPNDPRIQPAAPVYGVVNAASDRGTFNANGPQLNVTVGDAAHVEDRLALEGDMAKELFRDWARRAKPGDMVAVGQRLIFRKADA